ncbi:MAG: hypothetical protein PGN34_26450 [Methylobacterium frigidaeris]
MSRRSLWAIHDHTPCADTMSKSRRAVSPARSAKLSSRNSTLVSPASAAARRARAMWAGLKSIATTRARGLAAAITAAVIPWPQPSSQ